MNMFALVMLQKEFADALGVPVGSYTHIATSWHCYPQDEEMLRTFVKNITSRECTYCYEGSWKELMEAEKPAIEEMVEEQYQKYLLEKPCCKNCSQWCNVKHLYGDLEKMCCYDFKPKKGKVNE